MKKVLFVAIAMLSLVFVSCNKEDDRDAFVGTYAGKVNVKGTELIGDEIHTVSESIDGTFTISKDGKKGSRVTISAAGLVYGQTGSLSGTVDGNVLTIDGVHVSQEAFDFEGDKIVLSIDLVFEPAQLVNNHMTLNGSVHTLQISGPLKDELDAVLLVEAHKQ